MFPTKGLLQHVQCPDQKLGRCDRFSCPFQHRPQLSTNEKKRQVEEAEDSRAKHSADQQATTTKKRHLDRSLSSSNAGSAHAPGQRAISALDRQLRPDAVAHVKNQSATATTLRTSTSVAPSTQRTTASAKSTTPRAPSSSTTTYPVTQGAPSLPRGAHPIGSKVPLSVREASLRTFYTTFVNLYAPLSRRSDSEAQDNREVQVTLEDVVQQLASQHALASEQAVYAASNTNAVTYRNSIRTTLVGIVRRQKEDAQMSGMAKMATDVRKRLGDLAEELESIDLKKAAVDILQASELIGTPAEVRLKLDALEERRKGRLTIERIEKHGLIATDEQLIKCQYPVPPDFAETSNLERSIVQAWGKGDERRSLEGQEVLCARCTVKFVVQPLQEGGAEAEACCYHWGRRRFVHDVGRTRGPRTPRWTCCGATDEGSSLISTAQIARENGMVKESEGAASAFVSGAAGCVRGPHVFKEEACEQLHEREAFKSTDAVLAELTDSFQEDKKVDRLEVLAFDCELVYTTAGMSLARLTVLDESGRAVLDVYVRPRTAVLDYNTRFSGVRQSDLSDKATTLEQARQALVRLMKPNSILVGHGLENDLKAVRLVHARIIDSAILYPHAKGLPFRMSLRELTRIHLGRYIQQDSDEQGHDAEEDARAALELVRRRYAELAASGATQREPAVTARPVVNPFKLPEQTKDADLPSVHPTPPSAAPATSIFLPKARRRP